MKKIGLSLIVAMGLGSALMAGGDIEPVEDEPAVVESWSGFHLGLQFGGVWNGIDVDYDELGGGYGTFTSPNMNVDGMVGGIYGGYNWLLENDWLVGVDAEWNYSNADATAVIQNAVPGWESVVEQNWDAALQVKVGKIVEEYLFYATAGVAWGDFDLKAVNRLTNMTFDQAGGYRMTGWTVGAGMEKELDEHFYARLQYRYTDYGSDVKRLADIPTMPPFPYYLDAKLESTSHMLTLGVSYRF